MKLENTIQAVQNLGANVVKEGKRILKKKPSHETNQNTLYRGFNYLVTRLKDVIELRFEFRGAEDYWDFVDEGVKGSGGFKGSGKMRGQGSPFSFKGNNIARGVVKNWIKYKPLKLRNAQGRFIEKTEANIKSAAFVIGRAIAQRGLTRTRFFRKPFTEELNKQADSILDGFGKDIEIEIGI